MTLEDGVAAPEYSTDGAAAMDIRSAEEVELAPLERKMVRTGIRVEIPPGYEGQVRPRSGLANRSGISMVNTPGTIDSDYRGEIRIIMINLGSESVNLQRGERIAQLAICPVARADVRIVEELEETVRGASGFGSTGTK
jgi:dUTP pyrophosphatase